MNEAPPLIGRALGGTARRAASQGAGAEPRAGEGRLSRPPAPRAARPGGASRRCRRLEHAPGDQSVAQLRQEAADLGPPETDLGQGILAQGGEPLGAVEQAEQWLTERGGDPLRQRLRRRGPGLRRRGAPGVGVGRLVAEEEFQRLQQRRGFVHGQWLGEVQVVDRVSVRGEVGSHPRAEFAPGRDVRRRRPRRRPVRQPARCSACAG